MKIMIVDDNRQMRRMIVSLIDDLVEEIIECGDGSEAVPAYDEHRPDWVLMDIEMGRVDGIEATRQIRDAFPDARIVMVTHYDESELRTAASAAGDTCSKTICWESAKYSLASGAANGVTQVERRRRSASLNNRTETRSCQSQDQPSYRLTNLERRRGSLLLLRIQ